MFTKSEKRVIFFLIIVFVSGSVIRHFYPDEVRTEEPISPFPININTASKEKLMLLPGIGEVYAERIIEFRKENNGFRVKRDLLKVKGIGGQKLKRMNDMITIGGKDDDK